MPQVSATRSELLEKKRQIELAEQGLELLNEKRAALFRELQSVAERTMARSEALLEAAVEARRALARANAEAGSAEVRSAGLVARGELSVGIQMTNIMGVRVPEIEQKQARRSALGRGYAVTGTSTTIDEAAAAFEAEVESFLSLADSELRLRQLADEIKRTTRRANALEQIVLARLREERKYIEMALNERERAEHFRLKQIKRSRQRR
jgi:V/A-type H+-transporting ATPase subunit D